MKYIVLLGDGMSDEPIDELDGKTPLQVAKTPNMDRLAKEGAIGLAHTVPDGYPPGSDVANLSVFGYNPADCYSGRSPLEAASMGVELGPNDVAFRLNFVHLVHNHGKLYMSDFSAGHISTEESHQLIATLQEELGDEEFTFYPGISYRHLMVWKNGKDHFQVTPPHDLTHQPIENDLPKGEGADKLVNIINSAQMLLNIHPVNQLRENSGDVPANSIWLWGEGKAPKMAKMTDRFGITGSVISAVDLLKGIGIYAGLDVIEVPGATGYLDTNYKGKAEYALKALETQDFVYLHVEAPDEAAHGGLLKEKIEAIESFDRDVVGTVLDGIGKLGDYRVLVTPDHPTPTAKMTHTSDPVPFVLYGSDGSFNPKGDVAGYDEDSAKASGFVLDDGFKLMEKLVG